MSEDGWRVKHYNDHRVLVGVNDTLNSPYDGVLVCLTAGQLNIIRNLLQYATYRSTWVSEYHDMYYLAPTNDEWDQLQSIVSDLEGRLTVCEELTAALNRMAAALECQCTTQQTYSGLTDDMVSGYVTDGTMTYDIPNYTEDRPYDAARCAIANLTWRGAYDLIVGTIQPAQSQAVEGLLPLVLSELGDWLESAVEWAVGPVLDLVRAAILAWVQDELSSVAAAYTSNRQDLICAVYEGLAIDVGTASVNAATVINGIEGLSPIDRLVMRLLFGQYFIGIASRAWSEQSEWAVVHGTEFSCASCEQEPGANLCDDPIHPALYSGDVILGEEVVSLGVGTPPLDCEYMGPGLSSADPNPFTGSCLVDAVATWYSGKPTENTVGYVSMEGQLADESWVALANLTLTTYGDAGTVFETELNEQGPYNMSLYTHIRISISAQPMSCVPDPGYPLVNVMGFCFQVYPAP